MSASAKCNQEYGERREPTVAKTPLPSLSTGASFMSLPDLHGIICPVVTPFHADETLDIPRLRSHIDWLLAAGVHGIFVLGTTGEFYSLSESEKETVIAEAVLHVGNRAKVYAGTGAESTGEIIRLTKLAQKHYAAGVSVIAPYFIKPNQAEVVEHFRHIADSTSLPVILYNNPGTCGGLSIEPASVEKLAQTPNIVGIKDSSGDLQNTLELIKATDPNTFSVLMGRDTLILAALMFGAKGAIPAVSNVIPKISVGIYEAFARGDLPAAHEFQKQLAPVRMALSLGTSNGAVKEALTLMGLTCGPNRRPIGPLASDKLAQLREVLTTAKLI
jgi:4-hydroxy-tetrahydrodipicolinate synthase